MAKRDDRTSRGRPARAARWVLPALALLVPLGPAAANEPLPLEQEAAVFLKILTFDLTLRRTQRADFLVLVVDDPLDADAHQRATALAEELNKYVGQAVGSRTPRFATRSFRDLLAADDAQVEVLYLAGGYERTLPEILKWSRRNGAFTFCSAPGWRMKGASVWLGGPAEKPEILINLPQVKAEGRDLDARLLRLATVAR